MKKKVKAKTTEKSSRLEQKKGLVLETLKGLGEQVYAQLSQKQWPSVRMPSRSINNIRYDEKTRQYILGERSVRRSARNIRHVRPLTQLVWTGSFVDELTREGKTSTLRDVFYSAQAYEMSFADQAESDDIITDLETVLGHSREDFNVFPEERSAIFGDLTIQYTVRGYEGKKLNLSSHPDGMMIGPALTNAEFADCKADKIIAIEKGGLFTRFIEERVHEKYKALLIHTAGQAPRATRALLRRLNKELGLPVYIFCDADPWGMHIANVIISGSANAAHLRELNTPDAKWAGVWASITGDEPVIVSKDGLIRNESICEIVDPLLSGSRLDGMVALDGSSGLKALCCTTNGETSVEPISGVVRHKVAGQIYKLRTAGGCQVKATGNHSVQVFDPVSCELTSKAVSELEKGDLLASCFSVPNNETLTSVNLAELMLREDSSLLDHIFVIGIEASKLREKIRSKYAKTQLRANYPTIRRHDLVKLSYFKKERHVPETGRLRLRYSKQTLPVRIPVNKRFARLLGYHISEGNFSGGKRGSCCELTFSTAEQQYINDAAECIRSTLGLKSKIETREHAVRIRYAGSLLAYVFSELLGSGKTARGKRVPYIVFNFPDEYKVEFLRGYLRGDRVINYNENTRLGAKTASRLLAADLVVLLRQLGCVAYTYEQGSYYTLAIVNTEPIQPLVHELCGKNVKVQSKLMSMPSRIIYDMRDEIQRCVSYGDRTLIQETLFTNGGKGRVGYSKLSEAFRMIGEETSGKHVRAIKSLVRNKIVLLPLVAKERLDTRSPVNVYDLEVAGSHTFVGGLGGVVLHNSDIVDYKLPSDPLTDLDIKRLYELEKDPRYNGKLWKKEIETFLKVKRKAEQEAFSRYGLAYIVDKYLPQKLKEMS